jgi:predicted chitinase/murein DD-endopeptidase MepM/ murein hydrolase activator NlpD
MFVSPPFLPEPAAAETDDQFVERAMSGGAAGDGGYPLSFDLNWHGGLHLTAPAGPAVAGAPGPALSVRAVADGTIAFVRAPTPVSPDRNHPLHYRGGWTDDGCVIIRHETEIGADAANAPVQVVYFSIYMHLRAFTAGIAQGQRVFRKDLLGTAGRIYGVDDRLHFEIICDDANVERLTGRSQALLVTTQDGRTDAIFGAIWYLLPVGTVFHATEPQDGQPLPAVVHTSTEELFVRVDFRNGDAVLQTFRVDGTSVAAERVDAEFEYTLFRNATNRFPNSPSAGYELLRFGRVVGPDALNPAGAAHFRQIPFAGGAGFVNLNVADVRKFSDADFPHWDNTTALVDGSASADSRCTDRGLLELLDRNNDWDVPPDEATQSLNDPDRQRRLSRKIVKHRSEWDIADFDARYGWLKTEPRVLMSDPDFERLRAHATALSFWAAAALGIDATHWHFHPRFFVQRFRRCGWFALDELAQLLPRRPQVGVVLNFATAQTRFRGRLVDINRTLRKYNLLDVKRQTHFLAQTYIETGLFRTMREDGRAEPRADGTFVAPAMEFYAAFYGRGIMQLTWAEAYERYGTYRRFPNVAPTHVYGDRRITHTSLHYFEDPRDRGGNVVGVPRLWAPRYDPEVVADNGFAACDSGAFFWVSKNIGRGQRNIHRVADRVFEPASVARISVLVNGGGFGFDERQRWAAYVHRFRSDSTDTALQATITAVFNGRPRNIQVDFTAQRP